MLTEEFPQEQQSHNLKMIDGEDPVQKGETFLANLNLLNDDLPASRKT